MGQLKRQDADQLFANLLLSVITPDTINKINEHEWEDSLWQLPYEQRQAMAEYRDAARKLALAGYDLADLDSAISDVSQRLDAVDAARKKERELAAEYKTFLQVRRFVKGPKWDALPQENADITEPLSAKEQNIDSLKENPKPSRKILRQGMDL